MNGRYVDYGLFLDDRKFEEDLETFKKMMNIKTKKKTCIKNEKNGKQ